ncbi:MAG: hypothetical protein BWZ10_03446 [candidate division BRC1 bacterium ADurb.BinA364]|nr:MAG: hypothetical protein BWZ10_03446 [candidate division BRC1 bacterium ADurb.BinA364]
MDVDLSDLPPNIILPEGPIEPFIERDEDPLALPRAF